MPAMPGTRAAAIPAGVLHRRAHLLAVRRHRPHHLQAVRDVQGRRPHGERAQADGQDSGRVLPTGSGFGSAAKAKVGRRRACRRSLRLHRGCRARLLPPRGQQPVVRGSAELHDACARRQHRRADARRPRGVQGPRRHAVGNDRSVCAARACPTCRAGAGATCSSPCRP